MTQLSLEDIITSQADRQRLLKQLIAETNNPTIKKDAEAQLRIEEEHERTLRKNLR